MNHILFCFVDFFIILRSSFFFSDISKEKWEKMTAANGWNAVELRDNRYNHIVHMVSAANGAEDFYSTEVGRANIHSFKPIQFKCKTDICPQTQAKTLAHVPKSDFIDQMFFKQIKATQLLYSIDCAHIRCKHAIYTLTILTAYTRKIEKLFV